MRIDAVKSKIERAKKHIRDLDLVIRAFVDSQPYSIGAKSHPVKEIHHTTLYVASVQNIPASISLIVGDAIHNLRSALDHLMWQLVEAAGGTPDENIAFPIYWGTDGIQKYQSKTGNREIQKIGPTALNLLRAAQPWCSGDNTLRSVQELDIWDKHRLLILTQIGYRGWDVKLSPKGTQHIAFPTFRDSSFPLEIDQEITNIPTSTYEQQSHKDFSLNVEITFGKPQIVHGKTVLATLEEMVKFVEGVVFAFESFLL